MLDVELLFLHQDAFLCEECDALWFERSAIGPTTFVDFGTFMQRHGREGLWSEVAVRTEDAHSK